MEPYDNRYSLFVNWLKIILPLSAIALLSTLFLFAHRPGEGEVIPFAEIAEIALENRLSNPRFSGVGSEGVTFEISAEAARPDPAAPAKVMVENTRVELASRLGDTVEIIAGLSQIDTEQKILTTSGLTRITASSGYLMETEGLVATLATGQVESTGKLEIRSPFGQMTAGRLLIRGANDEGGLIVVFNQGVRLVYLPKE